MIGKYTLFIAHMQPMVTDDYSIEEDVHLGTVIIFEVLEDTYKVPMGNLVAVKSRSGSKS